MGKKVMYFYVIKKYKLNTDSQTKHRLNMCSSNLQHCKQWGWNSIFYFYIHKLIFPSIKIYLVELYLLTQTSYYLALSPTSASLLTYELYQTTKFVPYILLIVQVGNPGANLWFMPCLHSDKMKVSWGPHCIFTHHWFLSA